MTHGEYQRLRISAANAGETESPAGTGGGSRNPLQMDFARKPGKSGMSLEAAAEISTCGAREASRDVTTETA